jgi:hypothetical protein
VQTLEKWLARFFYNLKNFVQISMIIDLFKKSALWHSLWIKENPTQPFGLPDWPNDHIYLQTTSQGRLFTVKPDVLLRATLQHRKKNCNIALQFCNFARGRLLWAICNQREQIASWNSILWLDY